MGMRVSSMWYLLLSTTKSMIIEPGFSLHSARQYMVKTTTVKLLLSDRSKGLINVITRVFPSSPHGYYLRHLEANFMKANAKVGKTLQEQHWVIVVKIANDCIAKQFDDAITELLMTSSEAHDWLLHKSDVDYRANYLLKGMCWCKIYSNVADSFNTWIKEVRHLPVTSLVDSIRWDTHICPEIHKRVELVIEDCRFLRVGFSMSDTYEIVDNHNNVVSLPNQKYSCRKWEVHGLPCKYACETIMQIDMIVHSYVADYFTVE
ncbi:uncharacterized protein LOC120253733 [Dioscorea cayenensis subsp. rotundata]|uniref:Uncharacterized protein LOC120253733 n=1 Tax=Dioscorea cayennensis subsp. rotundata TaxID=55577 RepID=A0AB40AS82_DIOCR|nr:uncharacterized protein LOC120253733 [Dioscorea cayenensis subsp. rotundata]